MRAWVLLVLVSFGCGGARGRRSAAAATEAEPVVVYGARWCRYTRAAQAWLEARRVPFVMHDVEHDLDARDAMYRRLRSAGLAGGIPILDVRGRVLVGYDPEALERALEDDGS